MSSTDRPSKWWFGIPSDEAPDGYRTVLRKVDGPFPTSQDIVAVKDELDVDTILSLRLHSRKTPRSTDE